MTPVALAILSAFAAGAVGGLVLGHEAGRLAGDRDCTDQSGDWQVSPAEIERRHRADAALRR
jgi:hypothetical protein